MVRRAKHGIGRGPERLEERCLLAADTPLIVETVNLADSGATTLAGDISSPDEIDYYRFDIEQSGWLSVGGQPGANSSFDGQIRLFVFFDADGNGTVEADELTDVFSTETSFVGETGTTYLLDPGTFVISVFADLDENHQGEIGAYTLSLSQSAAINQFSFTASRVVVLDAVAQSDLLINSAVANGVQLSGYEAAGNQASLSDALTTALPSIWSRGLSLVVSESGVLLVVQNDEQNDDPDTSSGSNTPANGQPISILAPQFTRLDTAQLPAAVRPAAPANRLTTPSLLRSDSAGRSATRSIDLFRRGHSSQVGLIELALDGMLEATDDVLTLAADGLLRPLKETFGQPLEGVVPNSINIIEVSQPSWPLGRWLWQVVVGSDEDGANQDTVEGEQDNRSPVKTTSAVVPESEGDGLEPEDEDRVSSIGQSSAAYLIGKQTKTTPGAAGFASALVSGILWGNTGKASGTRRDLRYQRQLAAIMRRQMAQ